MNMAYRFRIYPTREQENLLAKTFGCCRFLYNQMLSDKIREYEVSKKMLRNTPAMYKKEYPFLKEVDALALANVQLHFGKKHIEKFFQGSEKWFPKIQVKTQEQKKLYNEPGKWKCSGRRLPDKTAETYVDPYEKAPGYTGKIPFEIRNGQHGTFRKVLCKSFV